MPCGRLIDSYMKLRNSRKRDGLHGFNHAFRLDGEKAVYLSTRSSIAQKPEALQIQITISASLKAAALLQSKYAWNQQATVSAGERFPRRRISHS